MRVDKVTRKKSSKRSATTIPIWGNMQLILLVWDLLQLGKQIDLVKISVDFHILPLPCQSN